MNALNILRGMGRAVCLAGALSQLPVLADAMTAGGDPPGPVTTGPGHLYHYVNVNNTSPQAPYTDWIDAATSIQMAVDMAEEGATVLVAGGIYPLDSPLVIDKAITVRSVAGYLLTTLDGMNSVQVCHVSGGGVLDGFTITRGLARFGGGLHLAGAGSTVKRCRITRNEALISGGGANVIGESRLEGCLIDNNFAGRDAFSARGGGLYIQDGPVVLENCTIVNNSVVPSGSGGGVYIFTRGESVVRNCIIYGNTLGTFPNDWHETGFGTVLKESSPHFSVDPFLDYAGEDYRLREGSPCIDTGTDRPWMAGARDLAGADRIIGARVDIGAFEYGVWSCDFEVLDTGILRKTFVATTSGSEQVVEYAWDFDGDGIPELQGGGLSSPTHLYRREGVYMPVLTVRSACGKTAMAVKTVDLTGRTWFTASQPQGFVPHDVVFTAPVNSAPAPAFLYEWDFDGDGTVDAAGMNLNVVTHRFTSVGSYSPRLVLTNVEGQLIQHTRADDLHTGCPTLVPRFESHICDVDGVWVHRFGYSVAASGDAVLVGTAGSTAGINTVDNDVGRATAFRVVYRKPDAVWAKESSLFAPDGTVRDRFGHAVGIDGDVAIVGAPGHGARGLSSGAAYMYRYVGDDWVFQTKLTASDGVAGDRFGESVGISGDTAVVGAYDPESTVNSGSAYVFVRGAAWETQQARLATANGTPDDRFGLAVAIDGDSVVVGAYNDSTRGIAAGAAYVFRRSGTAWLEEAKLMADDGQPGDRFGVSVSISGDCVVVGACGVGDLGSRSGAAYVFRRSGTSWAQEMKLPAADGAVDDAFGRSVAVWGDRCVVGAPFKNYHEAPSGAAYVFQRSGGRWMQSHRLQEAAAQGYQYTASRTRFGDAVAINGSTVVVGRPLGDGKHWHEPSSTYYRGTGSAHLFNVDAP